MSTYRELLLGAGHSRDKRMMPTVLGAGVLQGYQVWQNLITLDNNSACAPDLLCNMDYERIWPVADWTLAGGDFVDESGDFPHLKSEMFDEVHAYEVLEHLGSQGDARAYFGHFSEIWRILKPGGYLCATVPSRFSPWLWGDPSHRRLINTESLSFLDQDNYRQLDGAHPTSMSDFRSLYRADFKIIEAADNQKQFFFILQAVKPSRVRERMP